MTNYATLILYANNNVMIVMVKRWTVRRNPRGNPSGSDLLVSTQEAPKSSDDFQGVTDFVLGMMEFVLKMMDFVLKMMAFTGIGSTTIIGDATNSRA